MRLAWPLVAHGAALQRLKIPVYFPRDGSVPCCLMLHHRTFFCLYDVLRPPRRTGLNLRRIPYVLITYSVFLDVHWPNLQPIPCWVQNCWDMVCVEGVARVPQHEALDRTLSWAAECPPRGYLVRGSRKCRYWNVAREGTTVMCPVCWSRGAARALARVKVKLYREG